MACNCYRRKNKEGRKQEGGMRSSERGSKEQLGRRKDEGGGEQLGSQEGAGNDYV